MWQAQNVTPYPHPPPLRTRHASDCEIAYNTCSGRLPINQNPLQGHLWSYSMEALNKESEFAAPVLTWAQKKSGGPYKQCVCLCSKYKEIYGRILKSLNIVNLYRGMSKLKLKINVNAPQLLFIVVSVALNGQFQRFGGFCLDCSATVTIRYKKETRVESSFLTGPAQSRFSPRNYNCPASKSNTR